MGQRNGEAGHEPREEIMTRHATKEELQAGLPHILASPQDDGVLEVKRRRIKILDPSRLHDLCRLRVVTQPVSVPPMFNR